MAQPNEETSVTFPNDHFLTITNGCLPEIPEDDQSPIRLFAKITNYIEEQEGSKSESNVLLASFLPKSAEHVQLNYVFSPVNDVKLTVKGSVPVQLSGILQPILFENDEEEEEEEEANEEKEK